MIFDILVEKLAAAGFIGGRTVFIGTMPSGIEYGVELRVPLIGIAIDPYIPSRHATRIQIICRADTAVNTETLAIQVQKLLQSEVREIHPANTNRGRVIIDRFFPDTLPIVFPRLESNYFEASQHFDTVFSVEMLE